MTDTAALDLASLLASRLCHDMLSPVGALSNGLELLADEKDPEMRKRCFELLEQSAKISTDKLKFFRLAYGAAGDGRVWAIVGQGGVTFWRDEEVGFVPLSYAIEDR